MQVTFTQGTQILGIELALVSDSCKAIYRTLDGTCWRSIRVLHDIFCSEGISSTSNAGCRLKYEIFIPDSLFPIEVHGIIFLV